MNIIELIIYNCFSQLSIPENNEKLQERLINYAKLFQYNIGIITEQNLIIFKNDYKDKLNYNEVKTFLDQADSIFYQSLYTSEERDIIIGFHLSYGFSSLLTTSTEMVSLFEQLSKKNSLKEEIVYCIEEIKYALLTYYILQGIKPEEVEKLMIELEAIEDRHNAMNIFSYKENENS